MTAQLGRLWRNGNTYSLLMGVKTGTTTMEICVEVAQKLKTNLPKDPCISLLSIYPKDTTFYYRYLLIHIHIHCCCILSSQCAGPKLWAYFHVDQRSRKLGLVSKVIVLLPQTSSCKSVSPAHSRLLSTGVANCQTS